mmetsp:Transcript_4107/g.9310  ORF Transcript_4107/g.9310 Transcript_4107/m.9310 type:complete len:157 (+) Transcript_4107:148-618(+)
MYSYPNHCPFFCSFYTSAVSHASPSSGYQPQSPKRDGTSIYPHLTPEYVTQTMFVSNFIGICFSRTLHYQFYCWYFHTLPFLMWMTDAPLMMRIVLVGMVEYAFNVFPATAFSSYVLQSAHFVVLAWLWMATVPSVVEVHDDVHEGASRSKKHKKS